MSFNQNHNQKPWRLEDKRLFVTLVVKLATKMTTKMTTKITTMTDFLNIPYFRGFLWKIWTKIGWKIGLKIGWEIGWVKAARTSRGVSTRMNVNSSSTGAPHPSCSPYAARCFLMVCARCQSIVGRVVRRAIQNLAGRTPPSASSRLRPAISGSLLGAPHAANDRRVTGDIDRV